MQTICYRLLIKKYLTKIDCCGILEPQEKGEEKMREIIDIVVENCKTNINDLRYCLEKSGNE